ncbi:hypothetical protein [Mycoplasma sp. Mirounga ES2805-ORL]|uniref:hypothetical protein n=1 Tax=Mycoplasma sp. Mirounga ES2805-ORL TaxID=754514 RepID=UPI00197C0C6A|nr:hypothetical protein [Mycoplasma sp. Mirounga ES2805-ORL]QSF13942.1 hypothetical protein JXZ90_01470 [Mycoplasma sp. Mirounga ES2805-ORL]
MFRNVISHIGLLNDLDYKHLKIGKKEHSIKNKDLVELLEVISDKFNKELKEFKNIVKIKFKNDYEIFENFFGESLIEYFQSE